MCKNGNEPINIAGVKIDDPITLNNENEQILKHYAITIGYNKEYYIPNWVSYLLTKERCNGEFGRENKFSPDPLVADPVLHSDYTNNPYRHRTAITYNTYITYDLCNFIINFKRNCSITDTNKQYR